MTTRVLITCRQMQNCFDEFRYRFDERDIAVDMPTVVQAPSEDELISIIGRYDGMIAGDDPLTGRVLTHAQRLRIISKWGVGVDGIDRAAAVAHGITVTNTPDVFGDSVADVAAGYLVMLARQLHRIDAAVRANGWLKPEGIELREKTLGLIGFGNIGRSIAIRGRAFGMRVLAHDIADVASSVTDAEVQLVELDRLFAESDFLVLSCPLTEATHHMVDARRLALMRTGSFVVNVARGPLIDEGALVDALASGRLSAAALDVFEDEPLRPDSRLRAFEQCVFGSHNASNTKEGVLRASAVAVENVIEGLGLT